MIRSKRLTEDHAASCARCIHLKYSGTCYRCGIDCAKAPDSGLITMTTCDKWKGVRKDGG